MAAGFRGKRNRKPDFADPLSTSLDELGKISDERAEANRVTRPSYDAVMAAFKLSQGDAKETRQRGGSDTQGVRKAHRRLPCRCRARPLRFPNASDNWMRIVAASMRS